MTQREDEAREFRWYHDDDGMLVFSGRLPAADSAAFVKAMDVLVRNIGRQEPAHPDRPSRNVSAEPLAEATAGTRMADAAEPSTEATAESRVDVPAPTFPQKRADALVAMADLAMTALAADGKPACAADKYLVVVHIEADRIDDGEPDVPPSSVAVGFRARG